MYTVSHSKKMTQGKNNAPTRRDLGDVVRVLTGEVLETLKRAYRADRGDICSHDGWYIEWMPQSPSLTTLVEHGLVIGSYFGSTKTTGHRFYKITELGEMVHNRAIDQNQRSERLGTD